MAVKNRISRVVESVKKVGRGARLIKDFWFSEFLRVYSRYHAIRRYVHVDAVSGGNAIAEFVRTTFRSFSVFNKARRLSKSNFGRLWIAHKAIELVTKHSNEELEPVSRELKELLKSGVRGVDFMEGVRNILRKHLDSIAYEKVNDALGSTISRAVVSKSAVYDPYEKKLYYLDNGRLRIKDIDLSKPEDVKLLYSLGYTDKEMYVDYAEWKMMKIIDEVAEKTRDRDEAAFLVYKRIHEELQSDELFRYSFMYYIAKHAKRIVESEILVKAFMDLLVEMPRLSVKPVGSTLRRLAQLMPFGEVVATVADAGDAINDLGAQIKHSVEQHRRIRIELPEM